MRNSNTTIMTIKKIKRLTALMAALLFTLLTIPGNLMAQSSSIDMGDRFQIFKDASYVTFETSFAGFPVIRGSISAYQANIFFDPDHIDRTSATIRFGAASMSTAHPKRDEELHGKAFLDAGNSPGIWFQSTRATPTSTGLDLTGNLNIKDVTKEVTLHIEKPNVMRKAMGGRDMLMAKGSLSFKRSDFGLGNGSGYQSIQMLGDEINIEFSLVGMNYTLDYLQAIFLGKTDAGQDNPVGVIYQETKAKGFDEGMKKLMSLAGSPDYKQTNWSGVVANVGWILMVDGHGREAVKFFEFGLQKNPNHTTSLLRLGDAYVIAGDFDKALSHYRKEYSLPARVRFTHIPEMIKQLSGEFKLTNMK